MLRIDRETGVMSLGDQKFQGGMTPAEFSGLSRGGSLGDREWFFLWLDNFGLVLHFRSGRLAELALWRRDLEGSTRKAFHDELLRSTLGPESSRRKVNIGCLPLFWPWRRPQWYDESPAPVWEFPWGEVFSTLEIRDGDPQIGVIWKPRP